MTKKLMNLYHKCFMFLNHYTFFKKFLGNNCEIITHNTNEGGVSVQQYWDMWAL